jgi:hypothetical protein
MPVLAGTKTSSQLQPHSPLVQLLQVIAHNNTLNYSNKQLDIVFYEDWINVMIVNLLCCLLMVDKTAPGGSPGNFASRIGLSRNYLFICIHMILFLVYLL